MTAYDGTPDALSTRNRIRQWRAASRDIYRPLTQGWADTKQALGGQTSDIKRAYREASPLVKIFIPLVILILFYALPMLPFVSGFYRTVLVDRVAFYVLLALGLNVVVGFAGLLDLGYVAFYAIGAY